MEANGKKAMDNSIATLLKSDEPSVRFKVLVHVLERDRQSAEVKHLQEQIKASSRVQRLLSERDETGSLPYHPYAKWYGAHWVLADPSASSGQALADLGYRPGDASLVPLRGQVYRWLFGQSHQSRTRAIAGWVRRCAS
jgi:hypothetical protein